tara:strand:- start:738 stop:896 length:159 start_codon:yes stop_codon:yes gene_type:complete
LIGLEHIGLGLLVKKRLKVFNPTKDKECETSGGKRLIIGRSLDINLKKIIIT